VDRPLIPIKEGVIDARYEQFRSFETYSGRFAPIWASIRPPLALWPSSALRRSTVFEDARDALVADLVTTPAWSISSRNQYRAVAEAARPRGLVLTVF
jgi:hypothetical protein